MNKKDREDFEWASSFYLYDDLNKAWVNWDEKNFLRRLNL